MSIEQNKIVKTGVLTERPPGNNADITFLPVDEMLPYANVG